MPKLDLPLQLSHVFKPRIWGRTDLAPFFVHPHGRGEAARRPGGRPNGSPLPYGEDEFIGEVWLTDDSARFLNGPVAGLTLREASRAYGPDLHGKGWRGSRFPILAKYLYTSDWLSVQVHPDDDYARVHEPGNLGKCEMWYILEAEPNARCLLGTKPRVTKQSLRTALAKGAVRELLREFHPQGGEAVFVPPGTVHALGPGLILFEAEQNSDLTYRLDDFSRLGPDGKPRELHIGKGLEVTRLDLPAYRELPRVTFREPFGSRRFVVASRYFAVEKWTLHKPTTLEGSPERVAVLSLLSGEGRVETSAGWLRYDTGDTWLVPPATQAFRLVPAQKTDLLRFYVPDIKQDFRFPLALAGLAKAEINKIVFD